MTLSSAVQWVLANGPAVIQALLALVGALSTLFQIFHDDGATAFFTKTQSVLSAIGSKLNLFSGK